MSTRWCAGIVAAVGLLLWAMAPQRAIAATPPPGLTVMLTGDSVSVHLEDVLAMVLHDRMGWDLLSAAVPNCSVFGDALAWPDGTPHGDPDHCPGIVPPFQTSQVQDADPDFVIWWDRLSTMPFITADGEFTRGEWGRFWELRRAAFDDALARFGAGGARIVFVATEPMGIGVKERCAGWVRPACRWKRYRMKHYEDITKRENRMMRGYARTHPGIAVFISITDTICHENVSPCNDRMPNGILARSDGTHYTGNGEVRASRAIVREMWRALYP